MVLPSIVRFNPFLCSIISVGGAVLVWKVNERMELELCVCWKL